jgi:hypothetical protein
MMAAAAVVAVVAVVLEDVGDASKGILVNKDVPDRERGEEERTVKRRELSQI